MKQTAGIVLLMALMGASLAAQRPMTPSDYQPPPTVTTGQQPASGPPAPGGRPKPGKESENVKGPLRPLGLFPLQHEYFGDLTVPPIPGAAADDQQIYIALKNKTVGAWKIADAAPVWSVPDLAVTQPLALDGDRLYATLDGGETAALKTRSGKLLWRVPSGATVSAAPIAKAGWLILALETGELHALRGETGEIVWHVSLGAAIKTQPVIVGDRLYVAAENKALVALDLVTGRELWHQEFDEPVTAIAAQEHRLFISVGRMFYGLDHAGHIKWKRRIGAEAIGQPLADDEAVYVAFMDNTLMAFGADKGDLHWRAALTYRPISGPTRAQDVVLLTGVSAALHGYDLKEGKQSDFAIPAQTRHFLVGPPHFVHGRTFFQDSVVVLFAHGAFQRSRRGGGLGNLSPFNDPGVLCPPLSLPGEAPPPTAATAVPPKP